MTVAERLASATAALARAGVDTPRVDAEWLLADVLGMPRLELHLHAAEPLEAGAAARYAVAVARRVSREPLQQIVGAQAFRGRRVRVTLDVLVPRPETEILVDVALGRIDEIAKDRGARRESDAATLTVLDVGTGSGCIAAAIAEERPILSVVALDVSPAAALLARANAPAAVRIVVGDLLSAVRTASVDVVVSNPPYLPTAMLATLSPEVAAHEPRQALAGGAEGLQVLRRLVPEARRVLRPGGALVLETGGGPQAAAVAALLCADGFSDVLVRRDLAGIDRFVSGSASPPAHTPVGGRRLGEGVTAASDRPPVGGAAGSAKESPRPAIARPSGAKAPRRQIKRTD